MLHLSAGLPPVRRAVEAIPVETTSEINGVEPILSQQLTMEMKKTCDLEYQKRGIDFMKRSVAASISPAQLSYGFRCVLLRGAPGAAGMLHGFWIVRM